MRSFPSASMLLGLLVGCAGSPMPDAPRDRDAPVEVPVDVGDVVDAGPPDVPVLDASELDAPDAANDAGANDAGEPDAGEPDAGMPDEPDAGEPDAGEPDAGVSRLCRVDADCAGGACFAGICRVSTEASFDAEGLDGVVRLVAATDADGRIHLVTDVGAPAGTYGQAYDVVGDLGGLTVTVGRPIRRDMPLREDGRRGTPVAHASYVEDPHWVIVDHAATLDELRVLAFQSIAHDDAGALRVLTVPRLPDGTFPIRIWTHGSVGWAYDEVLRDAGTERQLHLRIDASGAPEVLESQVFWVDRWSLVGGTWTRTRVHTYSHSPMPSGRALTWFMEDDRGHTHLVHQVHVGSEERLEYVEIADGGTVVRAIDVDASSGILRVAGDLGWTDDGEIYFLTMHTGATSTRPTYWLRRIAPDGSVFRTSLGTLRGDIDEAVALAVSHDDVLYVARYAPTLPTTIRELR